MLQHPKDRPRPLDRRDFLKKSAAAGIAMPSLAAILAACGTSSSAPGAGTTSTQPALQLARPDNPVTLPIAADNPPIADGLAPEAGPFRIFGYADYIWKKVRNKFGDSFGGVDIEYSVFETGDDMVAKMQSNGSDYDLIVTVTVDNVGKLATGGLIQPLNYSYLPNVQGQLWPELDDFYDVGRAYAAPYVVFSTGIAWRNDLVSNDIAGMDNPYDIYWDEAFAGKTHLLNGSRDLLSVSLLRNGYDPNEDDPTILDQAKQDLLDGADLMGWKYDHVDYTELSSSLWEIHNTWSGQMVYYQYYLPDGVDITALSYAWPPEGAAAKPGLIGHDLLAIPKGAKNPVLAHELINYLYDGANALENYTYEGYQPPLNSLDVDRAVADGYLPKSLAYTFLSPEKLTLGVSELELAPAVNQLYQQIYLEVTGGA